MDDIEEKIRHFVSRTTSVSIAKVSASTRLGRDIGLDGMDAVEFFQEYEKEFQVDLSALWQQWSEFFGPEAGLPWPVHLIVIAAFALAVGIVLVTEAKIGFSLPTWLVIPSLGFLGILFSFIGSRFFLKPLKQISIAELVEAARQRTWQVPSA